MNVKQSVVVTIKTDSITPDPENLRRSWDPADINTLAENILEHGQMDPISVFERDDAGYDLLDGERRWRACKLAGVPTMRAIIVPKPSPTELLCKKISRALQTKALTIQEEVNALVEGLKALCAYDQPEKWAQAARKLGIQPAVLRERMRINKLSGKLRQAFENGKLDYSTAQTLGKIEDYNFQEKVAEFVVQEKLSNRFAVLSFIPAVLANPGKPLLEVYDLAKQTERYRYARPRKEETPDRVVDRIDEMLADFRKCKRWLEAAGKEDMINFLQPHDFNTKRLINTFRWLHAMLSSFLNAFEVRRTIGRPKKLPLMEELPPKGDDKPNK